MMWIRQRSHPSSMSRAIDSSCPELDKKSPSALFRSRPFAAIVSVLFAMFLFLFQYQASQCRTQISIAKTVATIQNVNHNIDVSIIEELYTTVTAERLSKIAKEYKRQYANAKPFPHIAIDHIFPQRFLEAVVKEMPEAEILNGCASTSTHCFKDSSGTQQKKSTVDDEDRMGMLTRILFGFMKSSIFINFLQELTNIHDIIPDPHYRGSGLHFTASGGNLDVHADFNK
jgi:hypothetical protein